MFIINLKFYSCFKNGHFRLIFSSHLVIAFEKKICRETFDRDGIWTHAFLATKVTYPPRATKPKRCHFLSWCISTETCFSLKFRPSNSLSLEPKFPGTGAELRIKDSLGNHRREKRTWHLIRSCPISSSRKERKKHAPLDDSNYLQVHCKKILQTP